MVMDFSEILKYVVSSWIHWMNVRCDHMILVPLSIVRHSCSSGTFRNYIKKSGFVVAYESGMRSYDIHA